MDPPKLACPIAVALALWLAPVCSFAQERDGASFEAAVVLLEQGRSDDALAALEDLAAQYAGRPWFDRVLGLALLRSGRPARAAMVLERAAAVEPQTAEIRLLLAEAYLAEGDADDAERELLRLAASDPPPQAAARIQQMLAAVADLKAARGLRRRLGLGLAAGHDSNANAGTDSTSFLGFTLAPEARRAQSPFIDGRLDANAEGPLLPRWRWSAGAQAQHREFTAFDAATRSEVDATLGLRYAQQSLALSGGLAAGQTWLGGSDSQQRLALEGGVALGMGARSAAALRLRAARLRYPAPQDHHDVDQWIGSLQWLTRPSWSAALQLQTAAIVGREAGLRDGPGFGRSLQGLRAGATWGADPVWRFDAGGLWSDYDDPFFGTQRRDRQWNVSLAVEWPAGSPDLRIGPYAAYAQNRSSVALYRYDRLELGVALHWSPR
ncbi:tetratricopeptide repeat protein [Fontimonas sp. SYSU GA230001]|uniref:tetratricopeptide repeat protein n=1 Tax=Fontimonas sp. SYSU GA230001 TaxID=3142450 RepID=UPI0032B3847A